MTVENWIHISGLCSAIIALVSLIVFFVSFIRDFRTFNRQTALSILANYTRRYEEIMDNFGEERLKLFELPEHHLPAQNARLTVNVLKYLNLCSEEHYLLEEKFFDKEMWKIWDVDMKEILASPAVEREWTTSLRNQFKSHPGFRDKVDRLLGNSRIGLP